MFICWKKSPVNFNELNLNEAIKQNAASAQNHSVFLLHPPFLPSEEVKECLSYDVNLNRVAVVCNLISQLATCKQDAENTSDRDVKKPNKRFCDCPSQWTH